MRRLPGLGRNPFRCTNFASTRGLTVSLPLPRGKLWKGRNDPSRQPRLSSCNYSFGKRRERYRGFESSSLRHRVWHVSDSPERCAILNDQSQLDAAAFHHRTRLDAATQPWLTTIPFLASSAIASRDLRRPSQPMPSSTALSFVNWIFAYSTICTRFPQGSLNSTPLPGKI